MIELVNTKAPADEKLGYFRPGFYPLKTKAIVPAIVCLRDDEYQEEPSIDFVMIRSNCPLSEWEDALSVSQHDFTEAYDLAENQFNAEQPQEKIEYLLEKFTARGYLLLSEVDQRVQLNSLH